jgi:hypothetical protein
MKRPLTRLLASSVGICGCLRDLQALSSDRW